MKVFSLNIAFLGLLLLMGCGSISGPGPLTAPPQSPWTYSTPEKEAGNHAQTSGGFSCPHSPNVPPRNHTESDGNFTLCKDNQNPNTQILIKGSPTQSSSPSEICLFIAQQNTSRTPLIWIKESIRNQPLYRCGTLSNNQVQISLPTLPISLNWNTAVIIDSSDISQMLTCIYYASANLCPRYSLGIVK